MKNTMQRRLDALPAATSMLLLVLLLAWDRSGGDLALADLAGGGPHGFALRDDWLLETLVHDGGRRLSWALALGLSLAVWWPIGVLRRLDFARRVQLAAGTLAAVLTVALLKSVNATSCPWDLTVYGGLARYGNHWTAFWTPDGGAGHCFPAGHASAGFAFIGAYFVFREPAPDLARALLALSLLTGLAFGLSQQLRGAHFMSHTLWTGWLCWVVAWACDLTRRHLQQPGQAGLDVVND